MSIVEIVIKSIDYYLQNYDIDAVCILKFLGMSYCLMYVCTVFVTLDSLAYFPLLKKGSRYMTSVYVCMCARVYTCVCVCVCQSFISSSQPFD